MRAVIVFLLAFSFAFAENWTSFREYQEFNPEWEVKTPSSSSVGVYNLNAKGGLKGIDCGTQGLAFYNLALDLNLDAVKDIIYNWKSSAYPVALYWLASTLPVVKEAITGAEYLSNAVGRFRTLSCESAMKMLKDYSKSTTKFVRACVLKQLGIELNVWTASPEEIEEALRTKSERQIKDAYNYCMNNATIFDAFNLPEINTYLERNNPRKYISCNFVKELGLTDLGNAYSLDREKLVNGGDAGTYAKLFALAVTPEFIVDQKTKRLLTKPIEVSGKVLTIQEIRNLLKESVDKEFEVLQKYVDSGDYDGFTAKVESLNSKFYVDDYEVMPMFQLWFLSAQKLKEIKDEGRKTEVESMLNQYVNSLKEQYVRIKKYKVLLKAQEELIRAMQVKEQEKVTGKIVCEG